MRLAFSTLGCPAYTVEQAVDAAARYGYEGIEWRCADGGLLGPGTDADVYRRIARSSTEAGIEIACLDTSCSFVQRGTERHTVVVGECEAMIDRAAEIGSPLVRVFAGAVGDARREDLAGPAVEALGAVVDAASRLRVGVVIETHDDWARSEHIRLLADPIPDLGICWDVVHTHRAGEAPVRSLEALRGRVRLVHVKDTSGAELVACGQGDVPLAPIGEMLGKAGYEGFLSFEWEKLWHPSLAEPDEALPAAQRYLAANVVP